jgi:predicted negative regulator of RcsB-dependent stress response
MFRIALVGTLLASCLAFAQDDDKRARVDVQRYTIEAQVNPATQTLAARTAVTFVPLEDALNAVTFELNNNLNISKISDDKGTAITGARNPQDNTVRLTFPTPLQKDQPVTVTFNYDGRLTGSEESPVNGIKFAAIQADHAFLLYPARWFPVNGYSADRFAAKIAITVPAGFTAIGSGNGSKVGQVFTFEMTKPSFPGSIAVVKDAPVQNATEGVNTALYFRGASAANAGAYGTAAGQMVSHFSGIFGPAPFPNMSVIETEDGAPNGYSAPGLIFLAPHAISKDVNANVLVNQIARQWWETQVSPVNRNHLWLENGMALYSEALWTEKEQGANALEQRMRDASITALTIENVPLIQAARLEDYSPEYWALTAGKGAAVMQMLRSTMGDQKFFAALKAFLGQKAWQSATTEDFRKACETAMGEELRYFFIQWIESSGAPEFKLEYTVFRTQKGFRVQGKIAQDLDTFRMPVDLHIETEGNPEEKRVEVMGTSSEFSVDTFGKPKKVSIDPANKVLRMSPQTRVDVAIRRGEQFAQIGELADALKEYQKALDTQRNSSMAHYRVGEVFFLQHSYQSAANEFREALNGDLQPKWVEVWIHIYLGKIFDISGQRDRAVNEYTQAQRTRDNTQGAQEEAGKYLRTPYKDASKEAV